MLPSLDTVRLIPGSLYAYAPKREGTAGRPDNRQMITSVAYFVLSQTTPQQGTVPYRDKSMDLTFERPAAWAHKKTKYGEQFEFTVSDGTIAVVQIFKTKFRQPADTWQTLQLNVATDMKRKVARQWEEQILSVPLMMTRIEFKEGGVEKATVVGLLYSATAEKLNFRINATAGTIDEAENQWRSALLTLRTLSGELPAKDDPTKPLVTATKNDKGQRIDRLKVEENKTATKVLNSATIFSLGRKVSVSLPKEWTIEQNGDDALLRSPALLQTVGLKVVPGGVPNAESVLVEANAATIDQFSLISLRDETGWQWNRVGAQTLTSVRTGIDAQGKPLTIVTVVATKGGLVWQFQYSGGEEKTYSREKGAIDELVKFLALEFEA